MALTGIDLEIGQREFVSLIGPSGCGKSTLLRVVGDLIPPSSGTVEVGGKPAHQARLDREYGMVFQAPVLFDWRTVEANVRLPLEVTGYPREKRDALVREKLELVELGGFGEPLSRTSFPEACSSAWPSPGHWPCSPRCCSWTSPSGRSMR